MGHTTTLQEQKSLGLSVERQKKWSIGSCSLSCRTTVNHFPECAQPAVTIAVAMWVGPFTSAASLQSQCHKADCTQSSANGAKLAEKGNTQLGYSMVLNRELLGTSCCVFGVLELGCFFFYFLLLQVQSFGLNSVQLPLSRHVSFQCCKTNV